MILTLEYYPKQMLPVQVNGHPTQAESGERRWQASRKRQALYASRVSIAQAGLVERPGRHAS